MKCCKHWPSSVPLPVTPKIWSAYILPLTCYTYPSKSVWRILIKIASSHFAWRIYSFKTPMRVKKVNIKYSLCDVKKNWNCQFFFPISSFSCISLTENHTHVVLIEILAFLSSKSFNLYLCTTYCEFTLYKFPPLYTQNIAGGFFNRFTLSLPFTLTVWWSI